MESTSNNSTETSPTQNHSDVTFEEDYSEEELKKAEEFKDKGNKLF